MPSMPAFQDNADLASARDTIETQGKETQGNETVNPREDWLKKQSIGHSNISRLEKRVM